MSGGLISAISDSLTNIAGKTLDDLYGANQKALLYVSGSLGGPFVTGEMSLFFDLHDFESRTEEGDDGYITVWSDFTLGVGQSSPLGMGVTIQPFFENTPDPLRSVGGTMLDFQSTIM